MPCGIVFVCLLLGNQLYRSAVLLVLVGGTPCQLNTAFRSERGLYSGRGAMGRPLALDTSLFTD